MPREFKCNGCPRIFKIGDTVFGLDVGKVCREWRSQEVTVSMLPLCETLHCKECAQTKLNMTATEVDKAVESLEAHIKELDGSPKEEENDT